MKKGMQFVVLAGLFLALMLTSACTLRASKAPALTPSPTSELLFLTSTPVADALATQTAAAKPAVATATPEPQPQPTEAQAGGGQEQAAAQPQANPIPTLTRPTTYTLQKGEWPICIARRYDLNLSSFFALNGLNMNSRPQVGTVLKIPSSGNWDTSAHGARALRAHTDYTVKSGDTVYTIACYFGDVSPEGILAANGLSSPSDIKVGMKLKIP